MGESTHTGPRGLMALVVIVLLTGLLAGCADEGPSIEAPAPVADPDGLLSDDGRDLRTQLTMDDELPAPAWAVGDWWSYQFTFGSQGASGPRITAIVTEAGPNGYFLATDDQQGAKEQAFDAFPVLGEIAKDLTMTPTTGAWAGAWDWFTFPLRDGATWTGEIPNIAYDVLPEGQVPLKFTAAFSESITVDQETFPGYEVEGLSEDGTPVVSYTYAPMTGWITSATVYDIDPGQDPIEFQMELVEYGANWTGTYYVDEAKILVHNLDGYGLTAPPPEGEPFVVSSPEATFTVSADATYLYGFVANGAVAGARATILYTPDGEARQYQAIGAPEQVSVVHIDESPTPGQWRLATVGAGPFSFSEVKIAEIYETTGTL